ncbi:MAG: GNAT family N-acetyltransferase [Pyrinomonadaceae bacterium]|nr:GNAT family N-acetyltransferase [Pyrinomonadaceae bacterium]
MIVRPATADDAVQIAYIYNHYIATSHATFELEPVDGDEMLARIRAAWQDDYPFLVFDSAGYLGGYAYGARFAEGRAFSGSVNTAIYVRPGKDGMGIGTALYERLLDEVRARNFESAIATISLPNDACVHLHEKCGFKKAAHLRNFASKFDRLFDVGYWQLLLKHQI